MNGWIKIHRSMLEWEHFHEPSVVTVFLALLILADKGKTEIGLDGLVSVTGLSKNTIRTALAKLVKSGEISRQTEKGQRTITTITNWNEYQVCQKLTHSTEDSVSKIDTPVCQKLTQGISENDTPAYQKLAQSISKIDTLYKNKNNNKNNISTARARMREEVMTDMMVEAGCRSVGITPEQYTLIADEIFNDWEFQDLPDNEWTKSHFLAVMRIKANIKRNGQNQQTGNPGDSRAKLDQDAVKAMASLATESRRPADVPF